MSALEPWGKSLRERLAMLKLGTRRVAYFAPKPDSGSFRYRCYNTAQAINSHSPALSASYFFLSDLDHIEDLSDHADFLVVFRTPYDTDVDRLISKFRRAEKKVFFDIDDLVFDERFAPLVASSLNHKLSWGGGIDSWFSYFANTGACMKLCDEVITTNTFLAERVREYSGLPTTVIPNFVNQEQLEVSRGICVEKKGPKSGKGLNLGYFSGSPTHAKDFSVAEAGIAAFLSGSPDSTLTILGHLELPQQLAIFGSRIVEKTYMNFLELQSAIAEVDVNLVPLQSSPFTFSKSELKFFEAALVETLTLATPAPVFSASISDGDTGFLASASEWASKLEEIQSIGPQARKRIASKAKAAALDTFSPAAASSLLNKLFSQES
jgi:glycosyltransferase involved in cell wall biosynthesis